MSPKELLQDIIEDWAREYDDLVKHPELLAQNATEYIFDYLLGFDDEDED
jgi:hypothetical protein